MSLLEDAERSLLEVAAVFEDGWTIEAAAQVADLDEDRALELSERLARHSLIAQQRQLDAAARQRLELGAVADGIEAFCRTVRDGLAAATFEQRRQLAELLIDRVVVTDGNVEIRYVLPHLPRRAAPPFLPVA